MIWLAVAENIVHPVQKSMMAERQYVPNQEVENNECHETVLLPSDWIGLPTSIDLVSASPKRHAQKSGFW